MGKDDGKGGGGSMGPDPSSSSVGSDTSWADRCWSRYQRCLAALQATAFNGSAFKVYVAADSAEVRRSARQALGAAMAETPALLRGALPTIRGIEYERDKRMVQGAYHELLILSRTDALLAHDLHSSSFSAVAAAWAVHSAGRRTRPRQTGGGGGDSEDSGPRIPTDHRRQDRHRWRGFYAARKHPCRRIPDDNVEPVPYLPILQQLSSISGAARARHHVHSSNRTLVQLALGHIDGRAGPAKRGVMDKSKVDVTDIPIPTDRHG